jgi:hypothetical protein
MLSKQFSHEKLLAACENIGEGYNEMQGCPCIAAKTLGLSIIGAYDRCLAIEVILGRHCCLTLG